MTDLLHPSADAKQHAALTSVAASLVLTVAKLLVGLATGSIAILSEAAHSLLDLGATLITLWAVRAGDQPPDADHPYGHGKIESMASLSETGLLLATSAGIVWEALQRLIWGGAPVTVTWWSLGVVVGSIAIDFSRSRMLGRLATETSSPALEADALHFYSDMISSGVVLAGLVGVALGFAQADSIAALGVAAFVGLAALRLGQRTVDALIDTAPAGLIERVRGIAERTPGIVDVTRVRARFVGAVRQIDLEAGVNRRQPLERVAELRRELDARLRAAIPHAEVTVSTFPVALDTETVRERILIIAAYHGHPVHNVTVQHLVGPRDEDTQLDDRGGGDRLAISFDIEIDARLRLSEGREIADRLAEAIVAETGAGVEVQSHLEPLMPDSIASRDAAETLRTAVAQSLAEAAAAIPQVMSTHSIEVRQDSAGLFIAYCCVLREDLTIPASHDIASRIETELQRRWQPYRIVSHLEAPARERPQTLML